MIMPHISYRRRQNHHNVLHWFNANSTTMSISAFVTTYYSHTIVRSETRYLHRRCQQGISSRLCPTMWKTLTTKWNGQLCDNDAGVINHVHCYQNRDTFTCKMVLKPWSIPSLVFIREGISVFLIQRISHDNMTKERFEADPIQTIVINTNMNLVSTIATCYHVIRLRERCSLIKIMLWRGMSDVTEDTPVLARRLLSKCTYYTVPQYIASSRCRCHKVYWHLVPDFCLGQMLVTYKRFKSNVDDDVNGM